MAEVPSKAELMESFANVTGVEPERARFFLEASNWQLETALSSFFEENDDELSMPGGPVTPPVEPVARAPVAPTAQPPPPTASAGSAGNPVSTSTTARGGLVTMDSIRRPHTEDSDDEETKGQAFYAGGSQTSGQQVLGPPRKKQSDLVAEMFKKAREHGAEEVNAATAGPGMLRKPGGVATFSGTGYKLGESSGAGADVVQSSSSGQAPESRQVVLRLWRTGFTLNDGPLREYMDPANREFLDSVRQGEIPKELIRDNMGFEVDVTMEDRHHEEYVPPKATVQPFFGKGNVLGSPVPPTTTSSQPATAEQRQENENRARAQLGFQENQPSTNLQLRLADGTRLAVRVNHTHTINDLHNFINTARPQYSSSNYVLTLFPNTELTKKEETVKDANLFNSALIQKLK